MPTPLPRPDSPRNCTQHSIWNRSTRWGASLLILGYLLAVIIAPLAGPPPASALANALIQPLRPLIGGLYLGHGYRFFAPDPGPGHSIRWRVSLPDGSWQTGSLPDPDADRPRLLYHRRFMISEKVASLVPAADAPPAVREAAKPQWQPLVKGIAAQLLRRHGGRLVELSMVEHYLPTPEESIASTRGADLVTPLGTYAFAGDRQP